MRAKERIKLKRPSELRSILMYQRLNQEQGLVKSAGDSSSTVMVGTTFQMQL